MDSTVHTSTVDISDRDRWMAWGGPAFLLLVIAGMVLGGKDISESASGQTVIDTMKGQKGGAYASVFLTAPAVAFLLVFTARLRDVVGVAGGAARHVMQSGAVLLSVALVLDGVLELGKISATEHHQSAVAQTLNVLQADDWIPFTTGAAVFLIGAGLSVLRSGVLPRWMGMVAAVIGVISLIGPGGFAGFFIGPLWIALAGVLLARRSVVAVARAV